MAVRNCSELGENLHTLVRRLMCNNDLVKLLYFTDDNPLSHENLTSQEKDTKIFNNLIKIIPKVKPENDQSIICIQIVDGRINAANDEFKDIAIVIELFSPLNTWFINGSNLRPFAIMGEIQKSLKNKTVNGLGKINGGDFELEFLTDEIAAYKMEFGITVYD